MLSFGSRLEHTFERRGQLCLGIDPHAFLLADWELPDTAQGVRDFGLRAVDAAADVIGIVKPQVAFFERHGAAGYAALEDVLAAARAAGLLVIADVKRGDIGSTIEAYGSAWLSPSSTLEADAMTVSAYQGVGSLAGPVSAAHDAGKGLFILAATSNPESVSTQTALRSSGRSVAAGIVDEVEILNQAAERLGSVGVVIGATIDAADYGIALESLRGTPILAPGFGEQGAVFADVRHRYGAASGNVIVNVGRGVLRAGPSALRGELSSTAEQLRAALAR